MKVSKASAMGTCFGVNEALKKAFASREKHELTILGHLVHNPQTVERLRQAGIRVVESIDSPIETRHVMITAHGASRKIKQKLTARGFIVEDATCPLVMRVHENILKMADDGLFPVVIGQSEHVEVKGIVGDLDEFAVIGSIDDIGKLAKYPRLGIVSQTTQQIKTVERIVRAIREQGHEEVSFLDTVCTPTKDRQKAVEELAAQVDVMVVVGGHGSSNTKKLKLVCEKMGVRAYHVENAAEIKDEWLDGCSHVGITAGTSTPDDVIEDIYRHLLTVNTDKDG